MHRNAWGTISAICAAMLLGACVADPRIESHAGLAANGGGVDQRVTAHASNVHYATSELARSFRDLALSYEFYFQDGRLINQRLEKPLERWEGTIRYRLIGDAVTARDFSDIKDVTSELSKLTGLRFIQTNGRADMLISIATASGREEISRWLDSAGLSVYKERYDIWRRTPGWICGVTLASDARKPGLLRQAHIFVAAEQDGMRQSCLEEEIAQSLGLPNDSEAAPSIFNDDQRFTHLTEHDKILLRTLYDSRLRPAMQEREVMPLVEEIISELLKAS